MTITTKMKIAVTLYRMYDTLISRNTDICFIANYNDFMSARDNEYIKKYLRNVGCLTKKVRECCFFDGISAEWKVDVNVLKSLLHQYNSYISSYDKYNETLQTLRTKKIKNEKEVVSKKKHLSEAPVLFTSKHRCKYFINNIAEVYDIVKQRYPFWDDVQSKINYINDRNVGLPKISFDIKVTHRKGIVSKVSARYSNCLVSMKAHEVDAYGNTERGLFCANNGLYYSFDVNASIHRLTYMLNHNGDDIDGDVYKVIYKKAFPKGKWNNDTRAAFKMMMMRNYFDTSARNAAKNYINSERKEGRQPDVELTRKIFGFIYPALREVEGQTFDNEIFFWESVIMINLIYEMMQKYTDLKVFSVYDGIYFNKPIEAEVAAMWKVIAHRFTLLARVTECKKEEPVVTTSKYSNNTIFPPTTIATKSNGCSSLYPLTDKLTFPSTLANNVKRNTSKISLVDFENRHCLFTTFNPNSTAYSDIQNAAKGKGIKHNSTNMKGIKHNKTDYADFFKEHSECVTTDYNNFKLAVAPLGLNKSKICRLWKWILVNIDTVKQ